MRYQRGFTFIELVIAVLMLGILTSIAYPMYTNSILKSNRTDAKIALMNASQQLQRCFTTSGTYLTASGVCSVMDSVSGTGLSSQARLYVVTSSNVTATSYVLTARPSVGSRQQRDLKCTSLSLDQAGGRSATGTANAECW